MFFGGNSNRLYSVNCSTATVLDISYSLMRLESFFGSVIAGHGKLFIAKYYFNNTFCKLST